MFVWLVKQVGFYLKCHNHKHSNSYCDSDGDRDCNNASDKNNNNVIKSHTALLLRSSTKKLEIVNKLNCHEYH